MSEFIFMQTRDNRAIADARGVHESGERKLREDLAVLAGSEQGRRLLQLEVLGGSEAEAVTDTDRVAAGV